MPTAPMSPPSSLRARIETTSRPILARLHALPRLLVPISTLLLIALGVFAPRPYGVIPLALLFVFIAWISYLSWPVVTVSGRLMRLAMLVLVLLLAATRV